VKNIREQDLVKQVLSYLTLCRCPVWRNNTGAVPATYKGKRRFFRFGHPGSPDVLAVLPPSGTLLGVECKARGRKPTLLQEAFAGMLLSAGACWICVSSLAELQAFLESRGIRP
jgi:hypothetical protein